MLLRVLRRFAASHPPHTLIRMPALSPTMTQGNIGAWRKQEGDALSVGDVLVEIETDKAQMDFESPEDGFLAKILLGEGEKEVQVSKVLFTNLTWYCVASGDHCRRQEVNSSIQGLQSRPIRVH